MGRLTLSGVAATRAGRTGESLSRQGDGEQSCGAPFSRWALKVRVTVVAGDVGTVERIESGTLTRKVVEDRAKRELEGRKMFVTPLFTITAVVQIKFEPER